MVILIGPSSNEALVFLFMVCLITLSDSFLVFGVHFLGIVT